MTQISKVFSVLFLASARGIPKNRVLMQIRGGADALVVRPQQEGENPLWAPPPPPRWELDLLFHK